MFRRVLVSVLLVALLCAPVNPQGSCGPKWELSGFAGFNEPGDANWQNELAQTEAQYGGPVTSCNYRFIIDDPDTGRGHYYGECAGPITCTKAPPIETTPGPSCTANPSSLPICAQPISLASGNTYITQTDVKVPGLAGGLALTRTWNSIWPSTQMESQVGLFGPNWRSTYEERVFLGGDGSVKYARSDGSFWSFAFDSLVSQYQTKYKLFSPANQVVSLLYTDIPNTPITWTLTFKNGEQRVFAGSGSLTTITDIHGNTTQLSYDGTNRLVSVTDPASRHLYFSYNSNNLVTTVTSDVGITLSYSYDSNGRLHVVTKPDQSTISFDYDTNSLLTSVKDSAGKVLEAHTYDSMRRGLTYSKANGVDSVTITYP